MYAPALRRLCSRAALLPICLAATLIDLRAEQVVISEIMYHPPGGLYEFVEIQNLTATPFDIASWKLRDGADFDFPPFDAGSAADAFLKAFERIVICETDPATFRAAYGLPSAVRVYGPWDGSLSNGGERITLKDKNGVIRCTVRYNDKDRWPVAADGAGHSLVLAEDAFAIDDYRLWAASPTPGGTPGSPEPAAAEEPYGNPEVDLSVGIPYINYADAWDFNDQNIDLGTTWTASDYDYSHAGWTLEGAAGNNGGLYGFESSGLPAPGIRTPTLNSSDAANHLTYYFRKEFTYSGPSTGVTLTVDLINDDGAGFYLNGQWIGGVGTTAGAGHTTSATRTVGDATEELAVVSTTNAPLVSGTNVIAVAGKQTNATSSDFVFGARISISAPSNPSVVINEILPGAAGDGFVEFFNPTAAAIDIGGWHLSDDPAALTKFTIPGSLVVPASGFASVGYAESLLDVASPTVVYLTEANGTDVANAVDTPMPLDGRSLGRKPAGGGNWFLFTSPTRNRANSSVGGGDLSLAINEVHHDSSTGEIDWVEFFNPGASALSTDGLFVASRPDLADMVPLTGTIAPGGFASLDTAFPLAGDEIQLFVADAAGSIVAAAAVPFENGRAHSAAFPDGSGSFYVSSAGSRDAANDPDRETAIVINELMIEPGSGHRDGELIELYNKGATPVDLGGWQLEEAVDFTIPAGTVIPAGGFVVIAANPALTAGAFPAATVLGPYVGNLANSGEYLRLVDAWDNTADEVHYATGGDWPYLAAGGGSSLELRHPDMDNAMPTAWAASDESNKSQWQSFTITEPYLQLRTMGGVSDYKELHIHGVGDAHLALRNIELTRNGSGANLLPGGGETTSHDGTGAGGWLCQGTHYASDTFGSEFHLISTGHGDVKANRCEIDVTSINDNDVLSFTTEARWISGKPTLVVNTWDRSFGGVIHLPVPPNLGNAGAPSDSLLASAAPTLAGLRHSPPVPTSSDPVVVSARVGSAGGTPTVTLHHRPDANNDTGTYLTTAMNDDGVAGDETAGDGIYSATLTQYQNDNQVVQFYVSATSAGGTSLLPGLAPEGPAMWVVDNSSLNGDLRTQRFVISQYHLTALGGAGESATYDYDFPRLSNQYFNATFISDEEDIIYNCELRKCGSPWTRAGGTDLSRAKWKTPGDRRFRGYAKRSIDNDAGGGRAYHNRIIRQWLYLFGHAANENEFVHVIVNGGNPSLREDLEPNANDFLKRNWEDGEKGELYRIDDEWWFDDSWNRQNRNADWSYKGTDEPERYHAEWIKRSRETEYDYASFTTWVSMVGTNNFTREEIERVSDIDMMAANAVVRGWCDDWDTLTRNRGKNGYFLRRYSDGKWQLVQWDSDLTFGNAGAEFIGNLAGVRNYFNKPYVRQRVNYYIGKMLTDNAATGPRLQAWFDCEDAASSAYDSNRGTYTTWHNNRTSRAQQEIGSAFTTQFAITTGNGSSSTTTADTIDLAGTSGWEAFTVRVVGHPEATVEFSSQTAWNITGIQLAQGTNALTIEAVDAEGNVIATDMFTVTKTGDAAPVLAIDADPRSWNLALGEALELDATASYDPEGTPLSFEWMVDPATPLGGATTPLATTGFTRPGIYAVTLGGTDGAASTSTLVREAAAYDTSGWSSFGTPILEDFWVTENLEVRDGDSPASWFTLDDRPGKLVLQVLDGSAKPLTMASPQHPVLWRALPADSDWALQSDVELDTLQQGDFNVGILVELDENGTTTRYAFGMEDGDFLRVHRASGGSYTQLSSQSWGADTAIVRIRRSGDELRFDRQVTPGQWVNVHTRTLPAGTTASSGGLFAATGTAQNARFEFDYLMLIDAGLTNPHLEGLRITEIMYHGPGGSEVEYIELTNTGTVPIELAGVTFDAGAPINTLPLPAYLLQPGESVYLTNDSAGFAALYGDGFTVLAQWLDGRLANGGERIVLRDPLGNAIHDFAYNDAAPWPTSADGNGAALHIIDPNGDYGDPANWTDTDTFGGSPAGSLPTTPLAWIAHTYDAGAQTITLRWTSTPLATYLVQASDTLDGWTTVATVPASGTGTTTHTAATDQPAQYYRIKLAE